MVLDFIMTSLKLPRPTSHKRKLRGWPKERRTPFSLRKPRISELATMSSPRGIFQDSSDGPVTFCFKGRRRSCSSASRCQQPSTNSLMFWTRIKVCMFVSEATKLFGLLKKYAPETDTQKQERLKKAAEQKAQNQKPDNKRPFVAKFGLNHVTTLVETKRAKLVVIACDVDPIELVVWLPQLCRRQEVPFCFVRSSDLPNRFRQGQIGTTRSPEDRYLRGNHRGEEGRPSRARQLGKRLSYP